MTDLDFDTDTQQTTDPPLQVINFPINSVILHNQRAD